MTGYIVWDGTDENEISKAMGSVIEERHRQQDEVGWTHFHDDGHIDGELAAAAACYSWFASLTDGARLLMRSDQPPVARSWLFRKIWPWGLVWWKPKDRRQDLVRAGALIIAEIERLDRAADRAGSST